MKTDQELINALNKVANKDMNQEPDERPWIDADTLETKMNALKKRKDREAFDLLREMAECTRANQLRKLNALIKAQFERKDKQ